MVKSVLGVNHQGLRDWIVQRLSALIMAIYFIGLLLYFLANPDLSFGEWHYLFSTQWMKVATLLFFAALLWHAWVGMWTIFSDYVHPYSLRILLDALVLLMLVACFFWTLMILWSL